MIRSFILAACIAVAGCASPTDGGDPLSATYKGCTAARAAVQATNAAVVAGTLKRADAEKAYQGLVAMQAGCNAAVAALEASAAASGVKP